MPLVVEVLTALQIPKLFVSRAARPTTSSPPTPTWRSREGWDTLIVTGDRDAFQLIDDHTTVLYTRRGISDTVLMDTAAVLEKYGVEPGPLRDAGRAARRPQRQHPRGAGRRGEDRVEAAERVRDLEGIFANLDKIRGNKVPAMLGEHRDQVFDGTRVATLHRDLPVPAPVDALRMGDVDAEAVRRLFATLEFRSLWDRLSGDRCWTPSRSGRRRPTRQSPRRWPPASWPPGWRRCPRVSPSR